MRNFLCDELFDCAFGDNEDNLNDALLQAIQVENYASYRCFGFISVSISVFVHNMTSTANSAHFLLL